MKASRNCAIEASVKGSVQLHHATLLNPFYYIHKARVLANGGVFEPDFTAGLNKILNLNRSLGTDLKIFYNPSLTGNKIRTSEVNRFCEKGYDGTARQIEYGLELVVNGDFSSDSSWNKSAGVTIANSLLTFNNVVSTTGVSQFMSITHNRLYTVTVKINSLSLGAFRVKLNSGTYYPLPNLIGIHSVLVISGTSSVGLELSATGTTSGEVDSISVREVLVNDLTQTTAANQPPLSKIAPAEKLSLLNPNGGSNYLTHPTISFAANEAWTVEVVLNYNYSSASICDFAGTDPAGSALGMWQESLKAVGFCQQNSIRVGAENYSYKISGKNNIITYVSTGGNLSIYINSILVYSGVVSTAFSTSRLFTGRDGVFPGKIHSYLIASCALTASEVAERAAILTQMYPDIVTVPIVNQAWAVRNYEVVATPMGNLIAEVQGAVAVEKITNIADREFSSDTGFWTKSGTTTISGGTVNFISASDQINKTSVPGISTDKWYKISVDIVTSNGVGSLSTRRGTYTFDFDFGNSVGTKIGFTKAINNGTNVVFSSLLGFIGSIDNVSVQEMNWANSQELYNAIYAQTSGTTEQKELAALKASAMWRSPNNDPTLAASFGKIYNKFAAKLIAKDIALYNAANPTTPWGYTVPTRSQNTTLSAIGGNAAKVIGSDLWTTANGTNIYGLSLVGSGYINSSGVYTGNKSSCYILCADADFARVVQDGDDTFNEVPITTEGGIIRLVKV